MANMAKKPLAALSAILVLWGCASSMPKTVELDDIPADKVAEIDALPEIRPEAPTTYAVIDKVEGISCKRSKKDNASWEDALRRTKYRAIKKGANAIADLDCEMPKGGPLLSRITGYFSSTCQETIRCSASAVRK